MNEHKNWSKLARRGLNKFSSLRTSKSMRAYSDKARKSGVAMDGQGFYKFVARARLRRKTK